MTPFQVLRRRNAGSDMTATLSAFTYTKQYMATPPHTSSAAITVTVTGGVAPVTFAWSSAMANSTSAVSPTSATTHFNGVVGPGDTVNAQWVCTATDATGVTAVSPACTVTVNGA